jgi:hypothetical protein
MLCTRSQVQGSTLKVKDKEGVENPEPSLKTFIFSSGCQFSFRFWIRPDETDVSLVNTHPNAVRGREWNLEPVNAYNAF